MATPSSRASALTVAVFPQPAGPVSRRMHACCATQHNMHGVEGKEQKGHNLVHTVQSLNTLGTHYMLSIQV